MFDVKMELETKAFNKWAKKTVKEQGVSTGKAIKKIGFDLLSEILKPEPHNRHPV